MKPFVSVLVPTYNHEQFIAQTLESILLQETKYSFEVLVGEDASSDGTSQICERFAKSYPDKITILQGSRDKVIYIQGMPTGRANLLRLLGAARGKYIAFCEGDDYWVGRTKLQTQVNFLEQNPEYSGSCHLTRALEPDGSFGKVFGRNLTTNVIAEDTIANWSPFHTSSFVFAKQNLELPLPDWFTSVLSADMVLFTLIALNGPIRFFPEYWSVYRRHGQNLTKRPEFRTALHGDRIALCGHLKDHVPCRLHSRLEAVADFHRRLAES